MVPLRLAAASFVLSCAFQPLNVMGPAGTGLLCPNLLGLEVVTAEVSDPQGPAATRPCLRPVTEDMAVPLVRAGQVGTVCRIA